MSTSEANPTVRLVWPSREYLAGYISALERGWSPNNLRPQAGQEELVQIQAEAARFLDSLVDREAQGRFVALPDGSTVPRLPGYRRWLWDGEFCGTIQLRSLLLAAPSEGLSYVEITTTPDNLASQHVIRANGGVLVEEFIKRPELGGTPELRFRIEV
jgi:predicted acetyltransferase